MLLCKCWRKSCLQALQHLNISYKQVSVKQTHKEVSCKTVTVTVAVKVTVTETLLKHRSIEDIASKITPNLFYFNCFVSVNFHKTFCKIQVGIYYLCMCVHMCVFCGRHSVYATVRKMDADLKVTQTWLSHSNILYWGFMSQVTFYRAMPVFIIALIVIIKIKLHTNAMSVCSMHLFLYTYIHTYIDTQKHTIYIYIYSRIQLQCEAQEFAQFFNRRVNGPADWQVSTYLHQVWSIWFILCILMLGSSHERHLTNDWCDSRHT